MCDLFLNKLNDNYKSSLSLLMGNDEFNDCIRNYSNIIKSFFSPSNEGFGNNIKAIINNDTQIDRYKLINGLVDIESGYDKFINSFYPGMNGLIHDKVLCNENHENINKIISSNANVVEFIDSLFIKDKAYICNRIINDLEKLISFNDNINKFIIDRDKLIAEISAKNDINESDKFSIIELYSKSITAFIYFFIRYILLNFSKIYEKPDNNRINIVKIEKDLNPESFKLFA